MGLLEKGARISQLSLIIELLYILGMKNIHQDFLVLTQKPMLTVPAFYSNSP